MNGTDDLILDGTVCEGCTTFIDDGQTPGRPRRCEECERKRARRWLEQEDRKPLPQQLPLEFKDER
jgi:hypothetical protein